MRYLTLVFCIVASILFAILGLLLSSWYYWALIIFVPLSLLGIWDMIQVQHSITRSFPILAHLRFLQEAIRPEIHQYFIESNTGGRPYSRDERSLIYERAKNVESLKPFGTELDVYSEEYFWLNHSIAPKPKSLSPFRIDVGGPDCTKPYSCSLLNVSAMSFGALSPNALMALNKGAKRGQFYHCTGEGGVSPYHLKNGGDLVWQIGTGYFGCRNNDGTFNADLFEEQAKRPEIKMIEIKISQGAKPGHGGVLPAAKVTKEISETRKVPMGEDCISPPGHSAFGSPRELCQFVKHLRDLSGGKPVGFKLCIGHKQEFLSICKAMIETNITPDFITVDGAEGGTGAAPLEFSNSLGMPVFDGLIFVQNALVGANLRDRIRLATAGKISSATRMAVFIAIGADWCNAARAFMMTVGCIQAQKCHTNKCPVGVATQDLGRQRALDVNNKSERAFQYHRNTMNALIEIVAACGLDHPDQLEPWHIATHNRIGRVVTLDQEYSFLKAGELLNGSTHPEFKHDWDLARSDTFEVRPPSSID